MKKVIYLEIPLDEMKKFDIEYRKVIEKDLYNVFKPFELISKYIIVREEK